jgi:hypothetical protein
VARIAYDDVAAGQSSKNRMSRGQEGEKSVETRMREFILQVTMQVEATVRSNKALEWHLEIKERRARALATSLDLSLSSQRLAEERWLAMQNQRSADVRRDQGQAWARALLLEQRVALLTTQVDAANRRAIDFSAATMRAQQERDSLSEALENLQKQHNLSISEHAQELATAAERYEERFTQRLRELNGELRDFLREEALRVLSRSEPDDQLIMLTMDLCAHKAEHKSLLEKISFMQDHIDTLRRQAASQREALQKNEHRLTEAHTKLTELRRGAHDGISSALPRSEGQDEVESILFAARSDLQYEQLQSECLRSELSEAVAAKDESERRERETSAALSEFQAAAAQELALQRQTLIADIHRMEENLKIQQDMQLARQQALLENAEDELARTQMELADVIEQRKGRPEIGVNTDAELLSIEREETENRILRMQEELFQLSAQVHSLHGELVATREEIDKKDDVIRSLETAIAAAAGKEGARPGGGASSLSKQLVAAKVAEAECQRRLRRALQTETELRQVYLITDLEYGGFDFCMPIVTPSANAAGDPRKGRGHSSPDESGRSARCGESVGRLHPSKRRYAGCICRAGWQGWTTANQ